MKILVLDDDPERHFGFYSKYSDKHDLTHVISYSEAIECMSKNTYDVVFLDHDLADFVASTNYKVERTGMDVVRWMIENLNPKDIKLVVVHSWNVVRAPLMVVDLHKAGFNTLRKPYGDFPEFNL